MFFLFTPSTLLGYVTFGIFQATYVVICLGGYFLMMFGLRPGGWFQRHSAGAFFFLAGFAVVEVSQKILGMLFPRAGFVITGVACIPIFLLIHFALHGKMINKLFSWLLFDLFTGVQQWMFMAVNRDGGGMRSVNFVEQAADLPRFIINFIGFLGLNFGIAYLLSRKKGFEGAKWWQLVLYTALCIGISMLFSNADFFSPDIWPVYVFGLLLLLSTLVVAVLVFYSVQRAALQRENERLLQLDLANQRYYKALQGYQAKIRKMNHDIANHLRTIQIMAQKNADIGPYTESLENNYRELSSPEYSTNPVVNAILTYKLEQAQGADIQMELDITLPEALPIDDVDLAALFTNLLDNAIRAAGALAGEGWLRVVAGIQQGGLFVLVENNCPPAAAPPTENSPNHTRGWGRKIIQEIVSKYSGTITSERQGDIFTVRAYLSCETTGVLQATARNQS